MVDAAWRILRIGSLAQLSGSTEKLGSVILVTESKVAESLSVVKTVCEFGPGWPPKRSRFVVLKAENVCQASAGDEVAERRFQGGVDIPKDVDRSSNSKSEIAGAEV